MAPWHWVIWSIIGIALGQPIALLEAAEQDPSAKMEVTVQLPVVPENQAYEGTFTLHNHHDVAIRITQVQAACTCDELSLPKHFLLPDEKIEVTYRVENHNTSGERRHKVWFYSVIHTSNHSNTSYTGGSSHSSPWMRCLQQVHLTNDQMSNSKMSINTSPN